MKSGIYKIQHVGSGRIYIGSSQDVYVRLRKHRERLRRGTHENRALQNGFSKYGEKSFVFDKIISCEMNRLFFLENFMVDLYRANTKPSGYNLRDVCESNRGMIFDKGVFKKGDKYGRLTLIRRYENKANSRKWLCLCDCGNEKAIDVHAVKSGGVASCGCLLSDVLQSKLTHKSGDKYHRLTLVNLVEKVRVKDSLQNMWKVRCDCGNEKILYVNLVTSGHTKSCGCLLKDIMKAKAIHGMRHTKEHAAWCAMRARAKKTGANICAEWSEFIGFFKDMGVAHPGAELLRRNKLLPFSKENCFWGTNSDLARNTKRNIYVDVFGKRMILTDAYKFLGVDRSSIRQHAKAFNKTYQQAADHFCKRYMEKIAA